MKIYAKLGLKRQVDENEGAKVTATLYPAAYGNLLADIGGSQSAAVTGTLVLCREKFSHSYILSAKNTFEKVFLELSKLS